MPLRDPVISRESLPVGQPWPVDDPFLFCVHHNDIYPAGNAQLGPAATLEGRNMGSDFGRKDGWSMYHGMTVPGFPRHPHRGFETVTVVRKGLIDHADSLGAAARYGDGDVQWLTAGDGINHAEMFPLLKNDGPNPTDFFQIWLNLPKANKRVKPHFAMFWSDTVPVSSTADGAGRKTSVTAIAGQYADKTMPKPPPNSWAANADNDVAIWSIAMEPNAVWTLPKTAASTRRSLYLVRGNGVAIGKTPVVKHSRLLLHSDLDVPITNGPESTELLLLQGKPIAEPIARHGPFVMNTMEEIRQAYRDYQQTQFGGWPWPSTAPTHGNQHRRFARHADGREDKPA